MVGVYGSLLKWAADARGTQVPGAAAAGYQALAELVDLPLRQIRDFANELGASLRPVFEAIRTGNPSGPPIRMNFTLQLSIDRVANERYKTALAELGRSS